MTDCPDCKHKLVRSTTIIPGAVVLGCRQCNQFQVEGYGPWICGGLDLRGRLIDQMEGSAPDETTMDPEKRKELEKSLDDGDSPEWGD
jgi:hypothetical protein